MRTNEELENIRQKHNNSKEELCVCHKTKGKNCKLMSFENYNHSGGDYLEGKKEKQWIYYTCQRCGYQWALWKVLAKF